MGIIWGIGDIAQIIANPKVFVFWVRFFLIFRGALAGWARSPGAEDTSRFNGKMVFWDRGVRAYYKKQTDRQTDRQSDKQTDRQTDRQIQQATDFIRLHSLVAQGGRRMTGSAQTRYEARWTFF